VLLDEKIVALEVALERADVPHAFGGAHALAYYATPRATADIDLNVFVAAHRTGQVLRVLQGLGVAADDPKLAVRAERDGQVRVFWGATPIDLFFSYDPLHDSSMERRRTVDFGGDRIRILSAEDLVIYKVVFDRDKDWRDIAEMAFAAEQPLDMDYLRGWLGRILAPEDPRLARLEAVVGSGGERLS
jgi:hypothetical protein